MPILSSSFDQIQCYFAYVGHSLTRLRVAKGKLHQSEHPWKMTCTVEKKSLAVIA